MSHSFVERPRKWWVNPVILSVGGIVIGIVLGQWWFFIGTLLGWPIAVAMERRR